MATQRAIPGANLPESGTPGGRKSRTDELGTDASFTTGATGQGNISPGESYAGSRVGVGGDAFGTTGESNVGADLGQGDESNVQQYPRATGVMDKVKQQASTRVNEQKERAAQGLGSVAAAIRQANEHLRAENQTLAAYSDKAVEQIQQFADRMRGKDPAEMMHDLERFARRNPTAFVGGAFLLGMGMARFLKSSSASDASYGRNDRNDFGRREYSPAVSTTGMSSAGSYGRSDDLSGSSVGVTNDPGITS